MDLITPNKLIKLRKNLSLSQSKLSEITNIKQFKISQFELNKLNLNKDEIKSLQNILKNKLLVNNVLQRKKRYQKHYYTGEIIKKTHRRKYDISISNNKYTSKLKEIYKKHINQNKEFNCISLFSGCGGFSLGASAAGFNLLGFVEINKNARDIYKLNFNNSILLGEDIREIDFLKTKKEISKKIDLIIGGPPCQGFSLAGKRDVNDQRNFLYKNYLDFIKNFQPKVFMMENVELLLTMKDDKNKFIKDNIINDFKKIGYSISFERINAADFGVPQIRKRVIFLGIKKSLNIDISFPKKIFCPESNNKLEKYRTFADAVSDLPFLESGENSQIDLHQAHRHPDHVIKWLWNVKEGCSAHQNIDRNLRPLSGYNTTYKRQIWDKPASTIQTTSGMISGSNNVHPICTRALTIREAARAQSFPDEFKFVGSLSGIRTVIGNAVPPLLSYEFCKFIKNYIL